MEEWPRRVFVLRARFCARARLEEPRPHVRGLMHMHMGMHAHAHASKSRVLACMCVLVPHAVRVVHGVHGVHGATAP